MLDIDVSAGSDWAAPARSDWQTVASEAVQTAIRLSPYGEYIGHPATFAISVKLSDDTEVQALNRDYRQKDAPTNVLSFPMVQPDLLSAMTNSDDGEVLLGDIILAFETCAREAREKDISLTDHALHLVVHGTLHLLGFDHGNDDEASAMEHIEIKALASMGLANPYSHGLPDTGNTVKQNER